MSNLKLSISAETQSSNKSKIKNLKWQQNQHCQPKSMNISLKN